MSDLADDTEDFARKLTESEEYNQRFEELIEEGFNQSLGPAEHLEFVVDTLFEEFVEEDENIQNNVLGFGDLLDATFKKVTAQKFAERTTESDYQDYLTTISL